MKAARPGVVATIAGAVVAVALNLSFGWIGTFLANMPGFLLSEFLRTKTNAGFRSVMFVGDWVFYTVLFWWMLQIARWMRARPKA